MRSFLDADGRSWEAVPGRESWGRMVAILSPSDAAGPVLEAPLDAMGYEEASRTLDEMDTEGLRRMLASAIPKGLA